MYLEASDKSILNHLVELQDYLLTKGYKVASLSKELGGDFGNTLSVKLEKGDLNIIYRVVLSQSNRMIFVYVKSQQGSFTVQDYLKYIGNDTDAALFVDSKQDSDYKKFIEVVVALTDKVFKENLNTVVEGREWVEIPFDWGDYK